MLVGTIGGAFKIWDIMVSYQQLSERERERESRRKSMYGTHKRAGTRGRAQQL